MPRAFWRFWIRLRKHPCAGFCVDARPFARVSPKGGDAGSRGGRVCFCQKLPGRLSKAAVPCVTPGHEGPSLRVLTGT